MATALAPGLMRPGPMRRHLVLAATGAVCVLAAAVIAVALSLAPDERGTWVLVRTIMVAAYGALGMYTLWHRPASRLGHLLVQLGLLYAVSTLTLASDELAHTIGRVANAGVVVLFCYVALCFPRDRLTTAAERRLVSALVVSTAVLWALALPLVEELPPAGMTVSCGDSCPDNALQLLSVPDAVSAALALMVSGVTGLAVLGVAVLLVGKARSPTRLRRRLVAPLLLSVAVVAISYALFTVLTQLGAERLGALQVVGFAGGLAVPLAMFVGQVRARIFAAVSLGEFVTQVGGGGAMTHDRIQTALRDALGDPLLTLALWDPHRRAYVGVRGRPVAVPAGQDGVGVTPVSRAGRPLAVLIHDAALDEGVDLTHGLASTALMLLENAQLVEELRASRARLIDATQNERLRLERDLHDGAQQHLFVMQVKLGAARAQAEGPLAEALDDLSEQATAALEDLRALAHGIYPTVLRDRGLADGVRAAALTAAVQVDVNVSDGFERCSPSVEAAVYFCVLEAIQNATKHAGEGARVEVTLARRGGDIEFSVEDDGVGARLDESSEGMGLVSMRDRIGAVGGDLEIVSEPGRGTRVQGTVPGCWAA